MVGAGEIPGGDRVGLGEVAFAVPEPTSLFTLMTAWSYLLSADAAEPN